MNRIAPFLLLGACAPQSATLTEATMVGWIHEDTSFNLYQGLIDFGDPGWESTWNIDCRLLEDDEEGLRLPDRLPICNDLSPAIPNADFGEFAGGERWLNKAAWRGFTLPLNDAWRGEGIYTYEGDLHVAFHHRLPGGQDFRFLFVIDPDFNPTECEVQGGEVVPVPVDGEPWLDAWARVWANLRDNQMSPFMREVHADYPDGRLYLLNARAAQIDEANRFNPTLNLWSLPEEWYAGFARGTFGVEDMHSRPSFYGSPFLYLAIQNDFDQLTTEDGLEVFYGNTAPMAAEYAALTSQDLNKAMPDGQFANFRPIHIDNAWREPDGNPGGLDGWQQIDYSWVVLSADSDPSPGGRVEGAFSILMDPDDSGSRWIVQGRFEIPKVRKERWGGTDLRAEKAQEAGLNLCIAGSPTDDGDPSQ